MCDSRDLGGVVNSHNTGRPTMILYDRYPGGLGYSEKGFARMEQLLEICREMVASCPCESGCPSCVGLAEPAAGDSQRPRSDSRPSDARQRGDEDAVGLVDGRRRTRSCRSASGSARLQRSSGIGVTSLATHDRRIITPSSGVAESGTVADDCHRSGGSFSSDSIAAASRRSCFFVSPLRPGLVKPIPGLLRRGEMVVTDAGEHWRVCIPSMTFGQAASVWSSTGVNILECKGAPSRVRVLRFRSTACSSTWRHAVWRGVRCFSWGYCGPIDGKLTVELLFARNYAEEVAVLASLWQRIDDAERHRHLQWQELRLADGGRPLAATSPVSRQATAGAGHLDMLHPARRRWKKELPDCKLQTLGAADLRENTSWRHCR